MRFQISKWLLGAFIAAFTLIGCNKTDVANMPSILLPATELSGVAGGISSNTIYTIVSPALNTWTSCASSTASSGICGQFKGSLLKMRPVKVNGNKITCEITRCDGKAFASDGTAYVKASEVCGTVAGQTTYKAGQTVISIVITLSFTDGKVGFIGTIVSTVGDRYYSPQVTISATTTPTVLFDKTIVTTSGYRHFNQNDATSCGSIACLPTSYMIARGISKSSFAVNKTELTMLIKNMNVLGSDGKCQFGHISKAGTQARTDFGSCQPSVQAPISTSENPALDNARTEVKNAFQDWINRGKPIIALVRYNINTTSLGHFVVVVGLKTTDLGTGSIVRYIDPYKSSNNINEVDLSQFLNSMKSASSFNAYNFLRISCQ